jgi:RNA polymerase sigma-70 factor (ECF subfamily)
VSATDDADVLRLDASANLGDLGGFRPLGAISGLGLAADSPRLGSSDDATLIAACRRGEQRAMEALYHQHKRRVFGLVHRIVGASDAEEVAQEVFVRVFRGLGNFRGDSALSTWVYRLAVNAALSYVARRGRRGEVADEEVDQIPAPPTATRDPRLSERVEAAMAQLPAGYRAILVLHDIEGLSHEECAAILDCRVGTSKSQLHKARAKMRDLLGPALAAERGGRDGRDEGGER